MNDVLPKPFTKEGLLQMLEKHLAHLKKPLADVPSAPPAGGMMAPGGAPASAVRGPSLKDEESPAKSPATTSNWNSPNQVPGVSPVGSATTDEYLSAGVAAAAAGGHPAAMYGLPQQPALGYAAGGLPRAPPPPAAHRRGISDISGGEDPQQAAAKRQQMFAPGGLMSGLPGRR